MAGFVNFHHKIRLHCNLPHFSEIPCKWRHFMYGSVELEVSIRYLCILEDNQASDLSKIVW